MQTYPRLRRLGLMVGLITLCCCPLARAGAPLQVTAAFRILAEARGAMNRCDFQRAGPLLNHAGLTLTRAKEDDVAAAGIIDAEIGSVAAMTEELRAEQERVAGSWPVPASPWAEAANAFELRLEP